MPPVFWNLRSKFYQNVREAHERHAEGVPFLRPSGTPRTQSVRYLRPTLPSARRADRRTAVRRIKFPKKVRACT